MLFAISMDERFTMANMAIEAGENGIMEPDNTTLEYVKTGPKGLMRSS